MTKATAARFRRWALCAALAVGAGALGLGDANAQMPDPALMNGRAIPAAELSTGTVTVRVWRQTVGNNVPDQTVRVTVAGQTHEATTDAEGRAEFPDLPPGAQGTAEVTVDGEKLVSEPFQVPSAGGLRVILVAGLKGGGAAASAAPAVKGSVSLGGGTRILMEFRDDVLQVFYMLDLVNSTPNPVDLGGPLIIELPTGAAGASPMQGSSPSATVSGDILTVQGPFAPGSTLVNVAFVLNHTSADMTIEQQWPVALEQVTVAIERIRGVNMASPQFSGTREVNAEDGTPYLLANGAGLPAGATLTVQLTGLPVHSAVPRYVGLALAVALLAFGGYLAFVGRPNEEDVQRRLKHRRDSLLGELAQLEERHRAGALDARGAARRQKLLAELEQIYGELDQVA